MKIPAFAVALFLSLFAVARPAAGLDAPPKLANQILMRLVNHDFSDPRRYVRLAHAEARFAREKNGADRAAAYVQALRHTERAYELTSSEGVRFSLLGELAIRALSADDRDKAESYADLALSEAERLRDSPVAQMSMGIVLHQANLALGLMALLDGDVEAAGRHLLDSARSDGSPSMNSFGPNMGLALALLERGEVGVVLEYFELCRHFWESGRDKLDRWQAEVNEGRTPNFGANLIYPM